MTISLPVLSEALPRASGWAMAARLGLPLLFLVGFVAPSPRADDWGGLVTVSSTMGVQDGRLCMGEGSRGDIGCPTYAPYVSRTTGYVGVGTTTPSATLHIYNAGTAYGLAVTSIANSRTIILNSNAADIIISNTLETGIPLHLNRTVANPVILASGGGNVGIGTAATVNPSTSLHVSGTLRIAAGNEPCDTNRRGAIKYENNDFHLCRNGTTWESLASIGSGGTPDRLISGTMSLVLSPTSSANFTTTNHAYINALGSSTGDTALQLGHGRTGNGNSYIDLVGDNTYSDFGLRIIRANTGANANTVINHRGTGGFYLYTHEPAPIVFSTSSTEAMRVSSNGNVGIGTSTPSATLHMRNAGASGRQFGNLDISAMIVENNGVTNAYKAFIVATAGAPYAMNITNAGQVGFGTATPTTALDVSGTVSATTLQLADNPSNPCNAANKGMAKVIDGRIYVCRYP